MLGNSQLSLLPGSLKARGLLLALATAALALATVEPLAAEASFGVNRIRFVSALGTDAENCQSLRDVLGSLEIPTVQNRYLVQLEPASYDCGSSPVVIPEGVAIQGSGVEHTIVFGTVDTVSLGVLHLQGSLSAVRALEVRNTGTAPFNASIAISVWEFLPAEGSGVSAQIRDVTASGATWSLWLGDSDVEVWGSRLVGEVHLEPTAEVEIYHSAIEGIDGSGARTCYVSSDLSALLLDAACAP